MANERTGLLERMKRWGTKSVPLNMAGFPPLDDDAIAALFSEANQAAEHAIISQECEEFLARMKDYLLRKYSHRSPKQFQQFDVCNYDPHDGWFATPDENGLEWNNPDVAAMYDERKV
jgi:hypothetical protein